MIRPVNARESICTNNASSKKDVTENQLKLKAKQQKYSDNFVRAKQEDFQPRRLCRRKRKKQNNNIFTKLISGLTAIGIAAGVISTDTIQKSDKTTDNQSNLVSHTDTLQQEEYSISSTQIVISESVEINEQSIQNNIDPQSDEVKQNIEKTDDPVSSTENTSHILPDNTFGGILEGQEGLVEELCTKYGVEPKFVAAIIGAETGWGLTGVADLYNPMSYRAMGDCGTNEQGFGIFSTPAAGLEAGISNLASYKDIYGIEAINIDNIEKIGEIYCEEDYSHWVNLVSSCYNSL